MPTRAIVLELDQRARQEAAAARRFPVSVSSETPVQRCDPFSGERFEEVLSHRPGAVDLSRAPLPLLEGHDRSRTNVGIVTALRLDGPRLRGELVLGASQRAQELAEDIGAGIVSGISVGYTIEAEERDEKSKGSRKGESIESSKSIREDRQDLADMIYLRRERGEVGTTEVAPAEGDHG